ncbi:hypothetical protein OA981_03025, partial [Prochlorococcus sp. AH-716-A09]|nr:hypothetical protein [Prochlorococcus sp. AH-716-A09]
MILYIAHRINSIKELKSIPENIGIEIDIRSTSKELILSHDSYYKFADRLDDFIDIVGNRFIIANIKSERIEKIFLENYQNKINLNKYFFLDSSFSMINKYGNLNPYSFSGRFSDVESIETIRKLNNKSLIDWIWIDAFNDFPIDYKKAEELNKLKLKKCLTSPDILGRSSEIEYFHRKIIETDLKLDAICCKLENINTWE